jgi:hypothetical protein
VGRFNTEDSEGVVMNENRASCIMPWVEAEGWVDLELSLDGGPFYWKGKFFVGKRYSPLPKQKRSSCFT